MTLGIRTIVAAALLAQPVAGQSVRGVVTEQASQRPIPGAVVFLLDANQQVIARDLTDERGDFRLVARQAGTYRVRTMRIGFRPVVSDPIVLAADQEVRIPLTVASVSVSLDTFRVVRSNNCNLKPEVAGPAYGAWNEVSTALNAALLSSRNRNTIATVVGYDRLMPPSSEMVLRQGASVKTGLPGMPWRSASADSLHRFGFVMVGRDGWNVYHAPDLNVLLSEVFLEDHCLRLRPADKGLIAIEFFPSRTRDRLAEIRGYVWLDATSLELRRIQYRYVNVPRQLEEADAGGEVEFLRLRDGSWIISRWYIRMPSAYKQEKSDSYGGLRADPQMRVAEVKVTGGDLLRVVQGADTLWARPPRTLRGTVKDSGSGRSIPNARVTLAGTPYGTRSDDQGRFAIENVLPGAYALRVHTHEMDSLATFHQMPLVFADIFPNVDVRIPREEHLLAQWCPAVLRGTGTVGIVVGQVLTLADSTPLPNTAIAVQWEEAEFNTAAMVRRTRQITGVTDTRGSYRLCGVPFDHPLLVSSEFDGALTPITTRIVSATKTRRLDIWIDSAGKRVATLADARPITGEQAQELKPVEVAAPRITLRDFEERRLLGIGHFITRVELEKQENRATGDVLSKVPGARITRSTSGGAAWIATGRGQVSASDPAGDGFDRLKGAKPACYADVWLDNSRVYTYAVGATLFDVNTVQPHQIEAIEFYSSSAQIPMRYVRGGQAQCGVLIIWTRR